MAGVSKGGGVGKIRVCSMILMFVITHRPQFTSGSRNQARSDTVHSTSRSA
jgi:hypothetical protein